MTVGEYAGLTDRTEDIDPILHGGEPLLAGLPHVGRWQGTLIRRHPIQGLACRVIRRLVPGSLRCGKAGP